jgi:hypothetical protein
MADFAAALRKLTSGGTLTQAERNLLGMSPAPTPTPAAPVVTPTVTSMTNPNMFGPGKIPTAANEPASTEDEYVTNWRSGLRAKKGTSLGNLYEKQNAEREVRDAAFANKPTEDPGEGFYWQWQERNQTWAKIRATFGSTGGNNNAGGNNNTGGANYTGSGTATDPLKLNGANFTGSLGGVEYVNGVIKTNNANTGGSNYTGSGTTNDPFKLNGANFTGNIGGVNYVNGVKEDTAKRTAQQDFKASLAELGLADLADAVDSLIRQDFTVAQIKLELPKQQAYKDRFPGMEALRAAGQAVNEATYISMERGYLQTLQAYGLDTKVLGSRKQLGTYVANLVSPREFEERVNLAATRVKDNADVISQFKVYYPEVDNAALTAYLLNPTVGMDIIKKQVRLAEIGAAAMDVGFGTGVSIVEAEELRGGVGEQDYQTIRSAFAQAKVLSDQQARLARIEGTNYSQNEAIQGIVGKDIQSQMASQKRAERETMTRFGGRSGVTSTSLRSDTEI